MDSREYQCTPMLRFYQRMTAADDAMRLANQTRLRRLKQTHGRDIRVFCAHDAKELEMFPPPLAAGAASPARRFTEPA